MGHEITAKVDKSDLRALFYLLNGRPDTRVKLFSKAAQIELSDIKTLNSRITKKLRIHNVVAVTTSIRVGYGSSSFEEFGTWDGFNNHPWDTEARIEEVVLKWDFMIDVDGYDNPQRHVILFRVSTDFKPANFLQFLLHSSIDDMENLDVTMAPAFCRVDFINAQISKELINEVSEWYDLLKSPKLIPSFWYWCKSKREYISKLFEHWILLSIVALIVSQFSYIADLISANNAPDNLKYSSALLAALYFLFIPLRNFSDLTGKIIIRFLSKIEGSRIVFNITAGDEKFIIERRDNNSTKGWKVFWILFGNFFLNLFTNLITIYLFDAS